MRPQFNFFKFTYVLLLVNVDPSNVVNIQIHLKKVGGN